MKTECECCGEMTECSESDKCATCYADALGHGGCACCEQIAREWFHEEFPSADFPVEIFRMYRHTAKLPVCCAGGDHNPSI